MTQYGNALNSYNKYVHVRLSSLANIVVKIKDGNDIKMTKHTNNHLVTKANTQNRDILAFKKYLMTDSCRNQEKKKNTPINNSRIGRKASKIQ